MEYETLPPSELIGILRITLALVSCNCDLRPDDPTVFEFRVAASRLMALLMAEPRARGSFNATHKKMIDKQGYSLSEPWMSSAKVSE